MESDESNIIVIDNEEENIIKIWESRKIEE
jgi:hypothetical protein